MGLDPIHHGLGGFDFRRPMGRSGPHIKDDSVGHLDELGLLEWESQSGPP